MFKRIAFAKIGWGETYTGEEIEGRLHTGPLAWKSVNRTPPAARRSRFGVRIYELPNCEPTLEEIESGRAATQTLSPRRIERWHANLAFFRDVSSGQVGMIFLRVYRAHAMRKSGVYL